jgi:uncharacterized C2H2 Zn-finger protein
MSLFHFDYDGEQDVTCPHCAAKFHVTWDTDYGDPLIGDHSEECPKCGKLIHFEAVITYVQ